MTIGITTNQNLAALQLHAISPLLQPARASFIAAYKLLRMGAVGASEVTAMQAALTLAKSVLRLEYDLKQVISGDWTKPVPRTDHIEVSH